MRFDEICNAYRSRDEAKFIGASENLIKFFAEHLTTDEIAKLARAIAESGGLIELPHDLSPFADIPSTGGPASLTTLACPILLATTGITVPKISATGSIAGAIDTMGIIPGFCVNLDEAGFLQALRQAGIAHNAQTGQMCPADRVLIQLRRKYGKMRHPALAAASLLAKKLAVPGTAAMFDFRLGPTGNIADNVDEAVSAANLFLDVADRLGAKIAVVITDGSTFPCSAIGRLESLSLLRDLLKGRELSNRLDREHRDACIAIAERARSFLSETHHTPGVAELVSDGTVWRTFVQHLQAQGGGEAQLDKVLAWRDRQRIKIIVAKDTGYWIPPELAQVKSWFKQQQELLVIEGKANGMSNAERQLGLRLLVAPGENVVTNQPVAEVRVPEAAKITTDIRFLSGSVVPDRFQPATQVKQFVGLS